MATDDGSVEGATWPMPKFNFLVDFGNGVKGVSFQEVSGLDTETQVIEYRKSNSKLFSTEKMPGIASYGNVTLKRGILPNDNSFWKWQSEISLNTIKRTTVVIRLIDESGNTKMTWTLSNAWPTKIQVANLKSSSNEVAIESIELAHEQLTISNGS